MNTLKAKEEVEAVEKDVETSNQHPINQMWSVIDVIGMDITNLNVELICIQTMEKNLILQK